MKRAGDSLSIFGKNQREIVKQVRKVKQQDCTVWREANLAAKSGGLEARKGHDKDRMKGKIETSPNW